MQQANSPQKEPLRGRNGRLFTVLIDILNLSQTSDLHHVLQILDGFQRGLDTIMAEGQELQGCTAQLNVLEHFTA